MQLLCIAWFHWVVLPGCLFGLYGLVVLPGSLGCTTWFFLGEQSYCLVVLPGSLRCITRLVLPGFWCSTAWLSELYLLAVLPGSVSCIAWLFVSHLLGCTAWLFGSYCLAFGLHCNACLTLSTAACLCMYVFGWQSPCV